jgi:hypothetical protein
LYEFHGDIPDVALADEHTGVVDGLGEAELVDASLETALQEVLDLQGQDVIELHTGLVEHTDTDETADERVTLEQALGVLLVEREERTAAISGCIGDAQSACATGGTHRAARRILERVNWTRHTSRLLRSPYSPTSFSSVSLAHH